ncbi:MAG: sialidase family protein [Gaiellaceae bacterium]
MRSLAPATFAVILGIFLLAGSAAASDPAEQTVTVPGVPGATTAVAWTGTVPGGSSHPDSQCAEGDATADHHLVTVVIPTDGYQTVNASFTFKLSWNPNVAPQSSDEILTVRDQDGTIVDSSDGSGTTEQVVAQNLPAGRYDVEACGFVNVADQAYNGSLEITTTAKAAEASVPSVSARGLQFSAAVPADPQRDEAEPLMEIDRAGNIYTCGPTGFSNASDYAQVSTDGGDQFHLLGSPPRGQQGAGGGGDCGLATGITPNAQGKYQYAYTGLGPLTGFVTSTSPNEGHNLITGGPFGNGVTDEGGGADRQWMTFVDDHTVLLSYNQQVPRNVVVQTSTDGGLTYGPDAKLAARSPRFPSPLRYDATHNLVFFSWDRTGPDGDHINLSISKDKGQTWTNCLAAIAPANTAGFTVSDFDSAGNIYVVYAEQARYHTYLVSLPAAKVGDCDVPVTATTAAPTKNPGFSTPVQVDRDNVRTTVFPWLAARGAPGRVAVAFYGTESDGNPNTGEFKASWDVYVNQSLNALDASPGFSQVKVTTHPFHYDSICLNGLGCDLAVPPGDRSLADFFAISYSSVTKKLSVVWNRGNKKPDEAAGHVATTMVATQIAGPSNGSGSVSTKQDRAVVRTGADDPAGDALSNYSILAPAPPPPTKNEAAADFASVSVGAVAGGVVPVTMKLANLSDAALNAALTDTASQSLLWVFTFANGHQLAGASARWSPATGFTFGFNDYTTGSAPCAGGSGSSGDKCVLYPGDKPLAGSVDRATGTIRLDVPLAYLRALSGSTGPGQRPAEVPAAIGSRLYDATAFSLANAVSPTQDAQSFLYPLDSSRAFDLVLAAPRKRP